ncbi:MAG: YecR family lipoprotein [Nitrospira sp.]|nr:YecR family lipoprotein [Nitrospira sp.]
MIRDFLKLIGIVGLVALVAPFAGCHGPLPPTILVPTAGSRADGIIVFEGQWWGGEVKWAQVDKKALERCQKWGYTDVERFEGDEKICAEMEDGYCQRHIMRVTYQCISEDIEK